MVVCFASQQLLRRHVEAAGPLMDMPLQIALDDLPLELGDWRGQDRPIEDERALYADQHLQRTYQHTQRPQSLTLWIVYSRDGEDRGHHPEVCMAVAGKPEDTAGRRTCVVPGHPVPVQQYRFGRPGDQQLVFYWHYTLPPPDRAEVDSIQRSYQQLRRRPSSVTLEVFAPEFSDEDAEFARQFVSLVDAAIQQHVGPSAIRGSQRLPVTVVQGG